MQFLFVSFWFCLVLPYSSFLLYFLPVATETSGLLIINVNFVFSFLVQSRYSDINKFDTYVTMFNV